MDWLQTISHIIVTFKNATRKYMYNLSIKGAIPSSASPSFFFLLTTSILIYTFYPLFHTFRPSDDYAIYTYFAEAVSKGINPYSISSDYRSEIVPIFFNIGWTQPSLGVVRPEYADYPPLLMFVNSVIFRLHNLKGLYLFYIFLYGFSILLYCIFVFSDKSETDKSSSQVNPLCFLIFFALNPLFSQAWFNPIEDKVWFVFFMIILLICRNRFYWMAVSLGLFAAVKGLGLPILFFYVLYMFFHKRLPLKNFSIMLLIFSCILFISHLCWFPQWIKGYQWRAARQAFVSHDSFFVLFDKLGIYSGVMPKLLTALTFLLLILLTVRQFTTLEETLLLPIVFSIIFNTELSFDRLLVAILAMLLLVQHNGIIVISYVVGLLLMLIRGMGMNAYSWLLMWGWTLFLLFVTTRQMLSRKASLV